MMVTHEITVGFTYDRPLTTDEKDALAAFLRKRGDGLLNNVHAAAKAWAKKAGYESLGNSVYFVRVS